MRFPVWTRRRTHSSWTAGESTRHAASPFCRQKLEKLHGESAYGRRNKDGHKMPLRVVRRGGGLGAGWGDGGCWLGLLLRTLTLPRSG